MRSVSNWPFFSHTAPLRSIPRPRRWPSTVGSLALGLLVGTAPAWAQAPAPPLPVPVAELTACEQLVSAWVSAHLWALGSVGLFAFVGFFSVTHFLMRVVVGLGERAYERCWQKPSTVPSGQAAAPRASQD